ncbi:MAG: HAMP domain-containing histidine kinase [Candidatus Pacebacteria bacterium]|nr:HAMP domain-containing histidine kinase [Candidatus Paceibacterota bacterium]
MSEELQNLQQELAKCQKENEQKSEFLSMIAHQLRTPLTGIKWTLKMLVDGDLGNLNEEQRTIVRKGHESSEQLVELLQELILANQSEAWDFQYTLAQTPLEPLVDDIITEFLLEARSRNITIKTEHENEDTNIHTDQSKLRIVLQNLIENGIKYTPEGGNIIIHTSNDSSHIIITVSDNGIGIPNTDHEQIFSKFFRASNAESRHAHGTGLGLFTAKKIIQKLGGTITFTSKEGDGTVFTITLPKKSLHE